MNVKFSDPSPIDGAVRWHLYGDNGQLVARSSSAYPTWRHAMRSVRRLFSDGGPSAYLHPEVDRWYFL